MESLKIYDDEVREGPDFFFEKDGEAFVSKNAKKSKIMWIGANRRIISLQKRKHTDAKQFLQDLLKNHLNKSGIPKGLKADIKKGFKVIPAHKATGKSIKEALAELGSTDATIFYSN